MESAIGTHFLTYREEGIEIFYYREGADEVDYILTYKGQFIALEIKTGKPQTKGLSKFISKFGPHRSYLISPEGITWQELLKLNPAELF